MLEVCGHHGLQCQNDSKGGLRINFRNSYFVVSDEKLPLVRSWIIAEKVENIQIRDRIIGNMKQTQVYCSCVFVCLFVYLFT